MPGLKQLEKFKSDIISLGKEAEIREQRGETVNLPPIPPTVKDIDDSNDFVLGMPVKGETNSQENETSLPIQEQEPSQDTVEVPGLASMDLSDMGLDELLGSFGEGESSFSEDASGFSSPDESSGGTENTSDPLQIDDTLDNLDSFISASDATSFDALDTDDFSTDSTPETSGSTEDASPSLEELSLDDLDSLTLDEPAPTSDTTNETESLSLDDLDALNLGEDTTAGEDTPSEPTPSLEEVSLDDLDNLDLGGDSSSPTGTEEVSLDDLDSLNLGGDTTSSPTTEEVTLDDLDSLDLGGDTTSSSSTEEVSLDAPDSLDLGEDTSSPALEEVSLDDLDSLTLDEPTPTSASDSETESLSLDDLDALNLGEDITAGEDTPSEPTPSLEEVSLDDLDNLDLGGDSSSPTGTEEVSLDDLDSLDLGGDATSSPSTEEVSLDDLDSLDLGGDTTSSPSTEEATLDDLDTLTVDKDTSPSSENLTLDSLDDFDLGGDNSDIDTESIDLDSINLDDFITPAEGMTSSDIADALAAEDLSSIDDLDSEPENVPASDSTSASGMEEISLDDLDNLDNLGSSPSKDSSKSSGTSEVSLDDFDLPIEDYTAPETKAEPENAPVQKKAPKKTVDDDLGFEIEEYSAPENATVEGKLSSGKPAPAKKTTKDDDLGFEIEEYTAPENTSEVNIFSNGSAATSEKAGASKKKSGDDFDLGNIEEFSFTKSGSSSDGLDLPDLGGDDFGNLSMDDDSSNADFSMDDMSTESFDMSAMEGMEFPSTDEQLSDGGFELDEASDIRPEGDEFEIPGFSDVPTVDEKKKGKSKKDDDEEDLGLPPNTLSDEQYKRFLDNLAGYPLNVRIALEQMIVDNEFTDETEFDVIKKVLKKVSARQLSGELEKMLDIPIPVPRDFERRTSEEYEAYKKSFQYQLKNRIIPGAIACLLAAGVCALLFFSIRNFIYRPIKASSLYKQGYTLLQNDDYPQSEMKFNEAAKVKFQKKWFFRYAQGYKERKQYARAEQMYKNILRCFNHNKQAGLEYARMELEDLANYEKAENVLLRECLDYYINDPECLLLLGDTYLEWATEKDPEKFEDARDRYSELISIYGQTDLYMSRMMRYFIRTNNLLEVLQIKEQFMPKKKEKSLGSQDWTDLSGFLLDKLYGYLPPSEEYLRNKIEDVKETLNRALRANPQNPIALYNFSRYYVVMNNIENAKYMLLQAIDAFSKVPSLKKGDMYKYIDSYRLLGEELTEQSDFLKAREAYTSGISLFNSEKERSNLEGTSQVGSLYADMGDLDYFIAGDMDSAKLNYEESIKNKNDNGKIRYKIGNINYGKKNYSQALGSFMKAAEEYPDDPSLLIAMGNTLSLRDDIYSSMGYYEHLKNLLDLERQQKEILYPQTNAREAEIVDTYMRTTNNLGVTLYKLSRLTGNSSLNAQATVNFQESLRAWDALTRNQQTLVRLGGSNLAEQNIRYLSQSIPQFEPAIYTEIPKTLTAEEGLAP